MTIARDRLIFWQGLMVGAALMASGQQRELVELDGRVQRLEQDQQNLKRRHPRLRLLGRLTRSRRYDFDGSPLYRVQSL
jgi:hypothetical protein